MRSLKELRRTTGAALCLECGKCSTMCPLAPFGGFSAARMMSMHEPESEIHEYAGAVERCLTCASCETRCPQGVRYTEFVRGLRDGMPSRHRRPRPHGEVFQVAAKWAEQGAGSGFPAWLGDDLEVSEEGEIALFVGCLPLFDVVFKDQFQVETLEIARAAIRMLNRLDIAPVIVGSERCCGHDLLWTGEQEAFENLAQANSEIFRERGVRHLVTACAECCRTWRVDYPQVISDYHPRVEHLTEFLAARVETGDLSFKPTDNGGVTFQDPCRLGRHLGVIDEPRQLLAAVPGVDLLEMERRGRDAICCGTSGFIHCDAVSRQLQAQRLRSAAETGATKLLTACPKCLLHFQCAQSEDCRRDRPAVGIEVEDLIVYLAGQMAPPIQSSQPATHRMGPTGE